MKKILVLLFVAASSAGLCQDLVVTGTTSDTSFGVDDIFTGTVTIKNTGIVDINTSLCYVRLYMSQDNTWDNSDLSLGYGFFYSLKAGQSKTLDVVGNKQISLPVGNYYLIAIADKENNVVETDETNNALVSSGYSITAQQFDFKFSSFSSGTTLYMHDSFNPQYTITNPGKYGGALRLFTDFYLSKDQTLDASDINCGTLSNWLDQALNNTTSTQWTALSIPSVTPGQYYMIAKVDSQNDYVEKDESNNTSVSGPVQVSTGNIDLNAISVIANYSGSDIFCDLTLKNNGTTGAEPVTVTAYLSSDQSLSGDDMQLWNVNYTTEFFYLPAGQTGDLSFNTIPNPTTSGAYYLIVVADQFNSLGDTNPNNNTAVSNVLFFSAPPPSSVSIQSANFTGSYDNSDKNLSLSLIFQNSGAANFNDIATYQLTIKDASNVTKYSSNIYPFVFALAGQTGSATQPITLSSPLAPGSYSVSLTCSDASKCSADSYNLSLQVNEASHLLTGKIQGEDGTPITKGKLFLYMKDNSGNVAFTQKVDPTSSTDFTFTLGLHSYTLYFIPDIVNYPQYVPTIFGKTVTLSNNNFFKLSKDSTVTFEVLKIQPLATGPQTITGNVVTGTSTTPSAARISNAKMAVLSTMAGASSPVTVLLLNSGGKVVGMTQTDASGNYQFTHLPAATYGLIVMLALDQKSLMKAPVTVDVSKDSKDVSFDFSGTTTTTAIKSVQSITFASLAAMTYTQTPFSLSASTSSGLSVSYSSSNPAVATVSGNQVTIVGVGTANIIASQPGNTTYKAAADVIQNLVVSKATLKATADNKTKSYGQPNPALTFSYSGFKTGENISSSGVTAPSISTTALQNSPAGTYPIDFVGGDGGVHYTLDGVSGTLTIVKASQQISFNPLTVVTYTHDPFTVSASSSSGLPVSFSSSNPAVATISNGQVTIIGVGTTSIAANQPGDEGYNSASVTKTLTVSKASLKVVADAKTKTFGEPNPELTFHFEGFKSGESIDNSGVSAPTISTLATQESNAGSYLISLIGGSGGPNYSLYKVSTVLKVKKADQQITFNTDLSTEKDDLTPIALDAQSSAKLPITFVVKEGKDIASVKGSTLNFLGKSGVVTVEAQQNGGINYNAASPVSKTFSVNIVTAIEPLASAVSISPNPTTGDLFITGSGGAIKSITLHDILGKQVDHVGSLSVTDHRLNLSRHDQGIYLLSVVMEDGQMVTQRIVLMKQ